MFAGASSQLHQRYSDGRAAVRLHIAFYPRQEQGAEIIQHGNRLADPERWTRLATAARTIAIDGKPVKVRAQRLSGSRDGRRMLVIYWYWVGGVFTADPLEAKVRQTLAALTGRGREAAVIAVAAESGGGANGVAGGGTDPIAGFVRALPALGTYLAELAQSGDAMPGG